jgi:hypothetical protein
VALSGSLEVLMAQKAERLERVTRPWGRPHADRVVLPLPPPVLRPLRGVGFGEVGFHQGVPQTCCFLPTPLNPTHQHMGLLTLPALLFPASSLDSPFIICHISSTAVSSYFVKTCNRC